MLKTIAATYDGSVFRPDDPLELKPNTRVRITIETVDRPAKPGESFLQVARSLELNGPADWATNLEEYLHDGKTDNG